MVNAFLEPSPGGPSQAVRTSRPGLTLKYTLGTGPITRNLQVHGLFNGDAFTISGGQVYRGSTLLGNIPYGPSPRMAAANGMLAIVTGGALFVYDGVTLSPVTTFDDGYSPLPPFSGVSVLYNIFVFPVVESQQFYFSQVGNPSSINAANVSAVQTAPAPIIESAVLAEELYFFTSIRTEIWDYSGQLTAPFAESQGRTYPRGLASQDSVCQLDNALFWMGDDLTIYRSGTVPIRVSTSFIEDRLKACGNGVHDCGAMTFNLEGHVYYILNLSPLGESYAYDCQTKEWAQWGTQIPMQQEPSTFIGSTCTGVGNNIQIGSSVDGRVWLPDPTNHTDDGTPIRVVVTGAHWMQEKKERMNNLTLHGVRGIATASVPNPVVWMRYSDDGGRTWSSWAEGSLGMVGAYRWKVSWHSLGLMTQPGREIEFAISSAVNVTIEGAYYNPSRR